MIAALPCLLWLLAADPSGTVTVRSGESLAQVAKRALGDERGAAELKALNALRDEKLAPGTALKLPGPDRPRALSALLAARHAVEQALPDAVHRVDASAKLDEAERLFSSARYPEAAQAADGAWRLVSESAQKPTRFTVEVAGDGKTLVRARSGQPVRVEAEGIAEPVYAGHMVTVERGQVPQRPEQTPDVPSLLGPSDQSQLKLRANDDGLLATVVLTWKAVGGAKAYEVEVHGDAADAKPTVLKVARAEAKLPPLAAGRYSWSVQALGDTTRSERSAPHSFELLPDTLKLEVKSTTWK